jgi:hypothetical protein
MKPIFTADQSTCILKPGMKFRYMSGTYILILNKYSEKLTYSLVHMDNGNLFSMPAWGMYFELCDLADMLNGDTFWELQN